MLLESKALLSNNFFYTNLILLKIQTVVKSHALMMGASNLAIFDIFNMLFSSCTRPSTCTHINKIICSKYQANYQNRSTQKDLERHDVDDLNNNCRCQLSHFKLTAHHQHDPPLSRMIHPLVCLSRDLARAKEKKPIIFLQSKLDKPV